MKKVFSEPEVKVVRVEDNNVICTSAISCQTGGSNQLGVHRFS